MDIDERDSDGLYRPVSIKPDGALRLVCGRPRRVNVRITQSDLLPFGLARVLHASLSPPMGMRDADVVGKDELLDASHTNKSVLRLVTSQHSVADLFRLAGDGQPQANNSVESGDGDGIAGVETAWHPLDLRGDSIADTASRSITAVLKWDHPAGQQQQESPDTDGMRTVYRIVLAFATHWSRTAVVVSKTIVTKISPATTSTTKRLARDREATQTAWWARESFSRHFRVGTWYSADIAFDSGSGTGEDFLTVQGAQQESASTTDATSNGNAATELSTGKQDTLVSSAITNHILGLHRMELGVDLERVRQQLWVALCSAQQLGTPPSESQVGSTDADTEPGLTVELVNQQLDAINATSRDASQHVECAERRTFEHGAGFFLRFKHWHGLVVDLIDGWLIEERGNREDATQDAYRDAGHANAMYYAHTPTGLNMCDDVDGSTEMCGFLMLSISHSPDDAAAALVAPLPSRGQPVGRRSITGIATSKDASMTWQRQWFVLRRPFLYAYGSYERKVLTGVMDISACQLVAPSAFSQAAKNTPLLASVLGSSLGSSSSNGRSWALADSPPALAVNQLPFTFRLVNMAGATSNSDSKKKCVVWTLQASTAAEMRSWLAVIQPFKMEERAAIASVGPVSPMVTGAVGQGEELIVEH